METPPSGRAGSSSQTGFAGGLVAGAAVAALLGAAGLVVEIALVRAAAPWFGQGTHVWANAIGVVLLALALGSFVGGRLADRDPAGRAVPLALAAAALALCASSRLVAPLAAWLAPADVAGDRPLPVSVWGSLALTTILAGPAVLVLGAVPPVLVRRARAEAGRAAAVVSAAGTVGGIVACAVTSTVVVPALGARGAIALASALVGLAALVEALLLRGAGADADSASSHARPDAGLASPRGEHAGAVAALLAAALVGFAAVVGEFTAFRALTPVCGATNGAYASVIAAVLLSLAVGNAVAGRARAEASGRRLVAPALVLASAAFVVAPGIAAAAARAAGPFVGALAGFGLPSALLGTACPTLVRRRSDAVGAGRAAGAIFGAATAASLAACYATPLLLLPDLGVRATSSLAGGLASLVAGALAWVALTPSAARRDAPAPTRARRPHEPVEAAGTASGGRRGAALLVSGVAVVASLVLAVVPAGPLRRDEGQVVEVETAYQTVRVVEAIESMREPSANPLLITERVRDVPTRFLRFDEDTGSYQSVRVLKDEDALLTAGRYYDHLALGAWFSGMPWATGRGGPRVLVVGYCGGTLHRILSLVAPEGAASRAPAQVVGVELDPEVTRLARERLGGFPDGLTLHEGADGRRVVEDLPAEPAFDLVLVDAYQRTQYVPFQLATREFFEACARRLLPHGAVGVNVNAPGGLEGELLRAVAASMGAALGPSHVYVAANLEYPTNFVVWGMKGERPPRVASGVPESLAAPVFTLERFLVRADVTGLVLTDDRAPVERLADRDLLPVDPTEASR